MEEQDLFPKLTRTERQKESLKYWIANKCKGAILAPTGMGKTRIALMGATVLSKKFPELRILVVVPTETLQKQWITQLDKQGLGLTSEVVIINTLIKNEYNVDLLILDEAHRYASDLNITLFNKVKYRFILALSATMERLDGKHELLYKYCPVVDKITSLEAIANGWVAESVEYKIMLDVDDIDVYKNLSAEFNKHFEFFMYNFDVAMEMLGKNGYKARLAYREHICALNPELNKKDALKLITYHATAFARVLQARKKYINNHPKKIELTREIIKFRPNAKIITFSATTDIAESIGIGYVYTGKDSKKKGRITIEEFTKMPSGVLNTVKKADEGLDVPGINVAVMLGYDSSPTRYIQRKGRAIRKEGNKIAEVFTFVLNNTVETSWFEKSHKDTTSIPIDADNLMKVLRGEPYETYKKPTSKFTFRF